MKYLSIVILLLVTSCSQRVTGEQIEIAHLLCENNMGINYLVADGEQVTVSVECIDGKQLSVYTSDVQ
jgi:hypothetical protein